MNRNWDFKWGNEKLEYGNTFGNKPFSEVETLFIKTLAEEMKPKVFLTLHSGMNALFMPYAYKDVECVRNFKEMNDILNEVKTKFCTNCQVGLPSRILKYNSNGTCLDYIYDKIGVSYAFGWEIYSGNDALNGWQESTSFAELAVQSKIVNL